jgi:hypothetical protein
MKINQFCKLVDCNSSYISSIINGHLRPGKKLARNIERVTEGQVTFSNDDEAIEKMEMSAAM